MFGKVLGANDEVLLALQKSPVNKKVFTVMMRKCLSVTVQVIERQYSRYFSMNVTETLLQETESARLHNIDAEQVMGMSSAAKERAPKSTLCYMSCLIRGKKNKVVDVIDSLNNDNKEILVHSAITLVRNQRRRRHLNSSQPINESLRREALKRQKKGHQNRVQIEKKFRNNQFDPKSFPEFEYDLECILTGNIVGRQLCQFWYDEEKPSNTLYYGKGEKSLKKSHGTYRVAYWLASGECYEDDAEDYDVSKFALAADLVCNDLVLD